MGEFAVFPLVIGGCIGFLLVLLAYVPLQARRMGFATAGVIVILMTGRDAVWAAQTYADSWSHPADLHMFDLQLTSINWFFRTDRREFGEWINSQPRPLLLPLDELNGAATRAWIMPAYPVVKTADDTFTIPAGTELVVPLE